MARCPASCKSGLAIALILLSGCGGADPLGRQAISGTVTLNGQPVDNGAIAFEPLDLQKGVGSGANIVGGKYSIPQQQGLTPGKYLVRISSADRSQAEPVEEMPGEAPKMMAKERIPAHWNLKSEQQIEVTADGDHVYDFDIK
jgi:hypothetical protein